MAVYILKQKTFAAHPEILDNLNPKTDTIEVLSDKKSGDVMVPLQMVYKLKDFSKLKFVTLPESDMFVFFEAGKYATGKEEIFLDLEGKYNFSFEATSKVSVFSIQKTRKKAMVKEPEPAKAPAKTVKASPAKPTKEAPAKSKSKAVTPAPVQEEKPTAKKKVSTLIKKYCKGNGVDIAPLTKKIEEAIGESMEPIGFEIILAVKIGRENADKVYPCLKGHFEELKKNM